MQEYDVGDHVHWSLPNGNEGEGEIVKVEETPDGTLFYLIESYPDDHDGPAYESVRDDYIDGLK